MNHLSPILNEDYQVLRLTIDLIAYRLGKKLDRNPTFDERGLTDILLDMLQEYLLHIPTSKYFINLQVTKPSEKKTGADILFRIKTLKPEIQFDRYLLIQAKKFLTDKGLFSETDIGNKHLSGQIERMHIYNPEFSYILLYSNLLKPKGNTVTYNLDPLLDIFLKLSAAYAEFDSPEKYYSLLDGGLKPQTVKNIKENYPVAFLRSKTWGQLRNNEPESLLNYSETFSNFLLDDIVSGKIGKEWDSEIEKVQSQFSFVVTLSVGQQG